MNRTVLGHHVRPVPLVAAFAVLAVAAALTVATSGPWWVVPLGIVGPDLAFVLAVGDHDEEAQRRRADGRMPRRVVPVYNLLHHPISPLLASVLGLAAGSSTVPVLAVAWLSHIVWDRAVGYGRRDRHGAQRADTRGARADRCAVQRS